MNNNNWACLTAINEYFNWAYVTAINFCQSWPCLNGGTCETSAAGYRCNCSDGYKGEKCEYGNRILF